MGIRWAGCWLCHEKRRTETHDHAQRYRLSAALAEEEARGVMRRAAFKQRDVRRTKGRRLEAEEQLFK